jgi:hypothetical protein
MAKRPARMSRMLRAMDQLMALPAAEVKGVGALLINSCSKRLR